MDDTTGRAQDPQQSPGAAPAYGQSPSGPAHAYGPPPSYGPAPHGPQAFGAMPYASPYPYVPDDPGRGLQVAGMICGIVGLVFLGFVLGPLGIIFGTMGRNRTREAGFTETGMGLTGIICGWIALALFAIVIIFWIVLLATMKSASL